MFDAPAGRSCGSTEVVVDQACRAPNLHVVAFALSRRVGTFLPPRDQKVEASRDERPDKHSGQAE